jgi:hypothetical protein
VQELFCKDTRKLVEMFNTDTIKDSDPYRRHCGTAAGG